MDIKIEQVQKKYKNKLVLSNINLTLKEGSFTAVLGPSGCGKTTLMRCLAGFLEPDGGAIYFGDQDVTKIPPQKRETAMVFQNYALWPHMTVYDNIAYGLKLRKFSKSEINQKVNDILHKVEIDASDVRKRVQQNTLAGSNNELRWQGRLFCSLSCCSWMSHCQIWTPK